MVWLMLVLDRPGPGLQAKWTLCFKVLPKNPFRFWKETFQQWGTRPGDYFSFRGFSVRRRKMFVVLRSFSIRVRVLMSNIFFYLKKISNQICYIQFYGHCITNGTHKLFGTPNYPPNISFLFSSSQASIQCCQHGALVNDKHAFYHLINGATKPGWLLYSIHPTHSGILDFYILSLGYL